MNDKEKDKEKDLEFLAERQRIREARKRFGRAGFYAIARPGPPVDKPDKPNK